LLLYSSVVRSGDYYLFETDSEEEEEEEEKRDDQELPKKSAFQVSSRPDQRQRFLSIPK
jgi:hypothetical protein